MRGLMTSFTQPNITSSMWMALFRSILSRDHWNLWRAICWSANSSIGNIPAAIKKLVPMATHSFPVPSNLISIFLMILIKLSLRTQTYIRRSFLFPKKYRLRNRAAKLFLWRNCFCLFSLANHVTWENRESGDLSAIRVIVVTSEPLKRTAMSETPKN